jgi:hypothetical protein
MKEGLRGKKRLDLSASRRTRRTPDASNLSPDPRVEGAQSTWLSDEEFLTTLGSAAGLDTPDRFPKIRY